MIDEINKSEIVDDKMIGCAAIILAGLCYKDERNYLTYGLNLLKKISKSSFDNQWISKIKKHKTINFLSKIFYFN